MLPAPGHRQGGETDAEVAGHLGEPGGCGQGAVVDEAAGHALLALAAAGQVVGEARSGRPGAAVVLAGEHAAAQRRVGQQADPLHAADLRQFVLAAAVDQGKVVLDAVEAGQAVLFRGPEVLHEAPGGFVAAADGPHLALLHQAGQRLQSVLLAHAVVGPVGLVEVDVVGLQPAQAGLAGLDDLAAVQGGEAAAHRRAEPAVARAGDLGGQDDFIPAAGLQPAADDGFGDPAGFGTGRHRVDFGGVQEVDASLPGPVQDGQGGGFVGLQAERHGSQADVGDHQAAASEASALHAPSYREAGRADQPRTARRRGRPPPLSHNRPQCDEHVTAKRYPPGPQAG